MGHTQSSNRKVLHIREIAAVMDSCCMHHVRTVQLQILLYKRTLGIIAGPLSTTGVSFPRISIRTQHVAPSTEAKSSHKSTYKICDKLEGVGWFMTFYMTAAV